MMSAQLPSPRGAVDGHGIDDGKKSDLAVDTEVGDVRDGCHLPISKGSCLAQVQDRQ